MGPYVRSFDTIEAASMARCRQLDFFDVWPDQHTLPAIQICALNKQNASQCQYIKMALMECVIMDHHVSTKWRDTSANARKVTVVYLLLRQLDLKITRPKVHVEHPLPLRVVVLLQYTDGMIHSGALQPQRVGTAVQRHHHLMTTSEHLVTHSSLLQQVRLDDGGGG